MQLSFDQSHLCIIKEHEQGHTFFLVGVGKMMCPEPRLPTAGMGACSPMKFTCSEVAWFLGPQKC